MYRMCSSGSSGLIVWSCAPVFGTPKYVSKCRVWFQQNVATRSPRSIPWASKAFASRAVRSAYSAYVCRVRPS